MGAALNNYQPIKVSSVHRREIRRKGIGNQAKLLRKLSAGRFKRCARRELCRLSGVYPTTADAFPVDVAMNKNLTLKMGNCNHRKYIPKLIDWVRTGVVDPTQILTETEALTSAIDVYREFDLRHRCWTKVKLEPAA